MPTISDSMRTGLNALGDFSNTLSKALEVIDENSTNLNTAVTETNDKILSLEERLEKQALKIKSLEYETDQQRLVVENAMRLATGLEKNIGSHIDDATRNLHKEIVNQRSMTKMDISALRGKLNQSMSDAMNILSDAPKVYNAAGLPAYNPNATTQESIDYLVNRVQKLEEAMSLQHTVNTHLSRVSNNEELVQRVYDSLFDEIKMVNNELVRTKTENLSLRQVIKEMYDTQSDHEKKIQDMMGALTSKNKMRTLKLEIQRSNSNLTGENKGSRTNSMRSSFADVVSDALSHAQAIANSNDIENLSSVPTDGSSGDVTNDNEVIAKRASRGNTRRSVGSTKSRSFLQALQQIPEALDQPDEDPHSSSPNKESGRKPQPKPQRKLPTDPNMAQNINHSESSEAKRGPSEGRKEDLKVNDHKEKHHEGQTDNSTPHDTNMEHLEDLEYNYEDDQYRTLEDFHPDYDEDEADDFSIDREELNQLKEIVAKQQDEIALLHQEMDKFKSNDTIQPRLTEIEASVEIFKKIAFVIDDLKINMESLKRKIDATANSLSTVHDEEMEKQAKILALHLSDSKKLWHKVFTELLFAFDNMGQLELGDEGGGHPGNNGGSSGVNDVNQNKFYQTCRDLVQYLENNLTEVFPHDTIQKTIERVAPILKHIYQQASDIFLLDEKARDSHSLDYCFDDLIGTDLTPGIKTFFTDAMLATLPIIDQSISKMGLEQELAKLYALLDKKADKIHVLETESTTRQMLANKIDHNEFLAVTSKLASSTEMQRLQAQVTDLHGSANGSFGTSKHANEGPIDILQVKLSLHPEFSELSQRFESLTHRHFDLQTLCDKLVPKEEVHEALKAVIGELKNIRKNYVAQTIFKEALRLKADTTEVERYYFFFFIYNFY